MMDTFAPPANIELEQCVIGSCMIDPDAYRQIEMILNADDFFLAKNRWAWDAFGEMAKRGEVIDVVVACEELAREQRLAEMGGMAYLTRCINQVVNAYHVREYAGRVAELAERRRTIGLASKLVQAAHNENGTFAAEKAKLTMQLQKDGSGARRQIVTARDAVSSLFDEVEYNRRHPLTIPGQVRHLDTGMYALNKLLGGLVVGLHYVAAVTSIGKTAFCLAIAMNVAKRGKRVLFVSPEMPPSQLIERMACAEGRIDSDWIDSGLWPNDGSSYERFIDLCAKIAQWPISILQTGSMQEIQAQAYYIEPDLIVLDGVERLTGGTKDRTHEMRGEIALWASNLAIDPDIMAPVLLPVQIAVKKVEDRSDKRPQLGDVYHTSEIDFITTAAMTLHRMDRWLVGDSIPRNHTMEVTLWKHRTKKRNVPDVCELYFGDYGEIGDMDDREPPPLSF